MEHACASRPRKRRPRKPQRCHVATSALQHREATWISHSRPGPQALHRHPRTRRNLLLIHTFASLPPSRPQPSFANSSTSSAPPPPHSLVRSHTNCFIFLIFLVILILVTSWDAQHSARSLRCNLPYHLQPLPQLCNTQCCVWCANVTAGPSWYDSKAAKRCAGGHERTIHKACTPVHQCAAAVIRAQSTRHGRSNARQLRTHPFFAASP